MTTKRAGFWSRTLGGTALALGLAAGVHAAPAWAVDFSGKTIEFTIPFNTGGGSDAWARFYAPLLHEALPGKPTVQVKNVPGGGSTTGTNQWEARAKPTGLEILGTSGSTQFPYLLGDPRVKYEYKHWTAVLATPTGGVVYINPDLGVKEPADLKKIQDRQMAFLSQGATSLDLVPLLAFELLGLKVDPIFGAKGRGDGRLAFERGEVNIDYQTTSAFLKNVQPLVDAGKAVPLFTWGALDENGKLVRDPTFPDLPHMGEVYEAVHGKKPSGPAWNAWMAFFSAGFAAQKMVFLPEGTPQEIIDTYSEAFKKIVSQPGFKEKAEAAIGEYPQATGKAAEAAKQVAINVAPEDKQWVLDWLKRRFNVEIK